MITSFRAASVGRRLLLALALLCPAAAIAACASSTPAAVTSAESTEVIDFTPARPSGDARDGTCFSTSLAVMRQGVYRCSAGNEILDPCFPIEGETGALVCGADPSTDEAGFVLRPTEPLPTEEALLDPNHAWLVKLADDTVCGFMTGGTGGVDGERLNYGCTDGTYLVGDLTPGDVWTARRVTMNTTTMQAETDEQTSIRTVWR